MSIPQRPLPSKSDLVNYYTGKNLVDIPKPAVVIDRAIVSRHCESMLQTIKDLGVGFRAHVKSHKTIELARLQGGRESGAVNFVASTVAEVEGLVPLGKEYRGVGRDVNILYGIPLVPSQVERLAGAAAEVGEGSVSVMIDHPGQVGFLERFYRVTGFPVGVFVKVDCGYHRAGLPAGKLDKDGLLGRIGEAEQLGYARLVGVYSHSSLSYGGASRADAMGHLRGEIRACLEALSYNAERLPGGRELVVSVGATPQAVAAESVAGSDGGEELVALKRLLQDPDAGAFGGKVRIELHAGNYPLLDMQQMSTNAGGAARHYYDEVGACVVAEACSVYNNGERSSPEALVAVGTLGLGREPCPSYKGWGVISPWHLSAAQHTEDRLIIDRISQEHSIVCWESKDLAKDVPLGVGQCVKIYPNHACITGAMYGWYLVVDSTSDSDASEIVDVWVRWSGW
ncbi:putative serine dehydratase domain-containing protein [Aspergillus avenaceus]|uniref:Putative serine dehydratase domain-containing protein n=1 Tax=Aspergillus avenaceus TaxID=36643 RepID=A0A5N6TXZ1_ASPAV|nr:putative serine dehydratase domain-containing protein [Aspergillus avenaceus]